MAVIQFVIRNDINNTININAKEKPTREQVKLIEEFIWDDIEKYTEGTGDEDLTAFDYYECFYKAVKRVVGVLDGITVTTTIYI